MFKAMVLRAKARARVKWRRATLVGALVAAGAIPAVAWADYWDYTGYLVPGASYGEAQAYSNDYWSIRVNRSNCNGKTEVRYRSTGVWEFIQAPGGCSTADWGYGYPLWIYDASHAINSGDTNVWVNVRIDGTL
jgi:hypothetical protein